MKIAAKLWDRNKAVLKCKYVTFIESWENKKVRFHLKLKVNNNAKTIVHVQRNEFRLLLHVLCKNLKDQRSTCKLKL